MERDKIYIGSRSSKLALIYAEKVKIEIAKYFKGEISIIKISTSGDKNLHTRLSEIGGKGLFSSSIEKELLNKKIDIAVHALKDLPSFETQGLTTNCFLKRNSPNEVMISNSQKKLEELVPGSIIGTSSFRREFQLKRKRKDLNFKLIRGNVDTRIKKLKNGEYDAIILSKAGLNSLNLENEITQEFSYKDIVPSAGQGTVAVQCRNSDLEMIDFLKKINHTETSIRVKTEREVLKVLDGDCDTAVGAISEIKNNELSILGELFSIDGNRRYYYETNCELKDYYQAGLEVGNNLKKQSKGNYKR
tara:strand:+ start:3136 stop:4047 length:912 start_codon:yes stop_codon:yes gene_type:complete